MSIFVAKESGTLTLPNGDVLDITAGVTHLREGDPFLKAHAVFFVPVEDRISNDGWEQATAAPGEKRKRAAKPKPDAETDED
jgi:hypothetical protein